MGIPGSGGGKDYGFNYSHQANKSSFKRFLEWMENRSNQSQFNRLDDSVRNELERRVIGFKNLALYGDESLCDLFNPATLYHAVTWLGFEDDNFLLAWGIKLTGERQAFLGKKNFGVVLGYRNEHWNSWLSSGARVEFKGQEVLSNKPVLTDGRLQRLEEYFSLRLAIQPQPGYDYTYRSRTEIK